MNSNNSIRSEYVSRLDKLLNEVSIDFNCNDLHSKLADTKGGVYRIFEKTNTSRSIYIGKATSFKNRIYGNLLNGNIYFDDDWGLFLDPF